MPRSPVRCAVGSGVGVAIRPSAAADSPTSTAVRAARATAASQQKPWRRRWTWIAARWRMAPSLCCGVPADALSTHGDANATTFVAIGSRRARCGLASSTRASSQRRSRRRGPGPSSLIPRRLAPRVSMQPSWWRKGYAVREREVRRSAIREGHEAGPPVPPHVAAEPFDAKRASVSWMDRPRTSGAVGSLPMRSTRWPARGPVATRPITDAPCTCASTGDSSASGSLRPSSELPSRSMSWRRSRRRIRPRTRADARRRLPSGAADARAARREPHGGNGAAASGPPRSARLSRRHDRQGRRA